MTSKEQTYSFGEDFNKNLGEMIRAYLQNHMETMETFIESLALNEGEVLTFGDFGAFNGFSSLNLILHMTDLLKRKTGHVVPVNIIYEDLPTNNFNGLVKTLKTHEMVGKDKVFVSMCPVGFYDQCQPENTFHIIFCTFSTHLLSGSVTYRNSLYKHPDATPEERKAVEKQAADDWITFLSLRAKEMKCDHMYVRGAVMMLTMPVEDRKNSEVHLEKLWPVMTRVWQQMKDEELISELEYEAANYQGYYRTEEELRAPFQDGSTVHSAGLYIQSLDIVHRPNHTKLSLPDDVCTAEKQEAWANKLTRIIRDWTEYIFLNALDQRPAHSRREVIDILYTRLVDKLICEDREDQGWDNILCYLVIRKRY